MIKYPLISVTKLSCKFSLLSYFCLAIWFNNFVYYGDPEVTPKNQSLVCRNLRFPAKKIIIHVPNNNIHPHPQRKQNNNLIIYTTNHHPVILNNLQIIWVLLYKRTHMTSEKRMERKTQKDEIKSIL